MLAAALTIARKDEIEANHLVQDHSMDGNRPGDIDNIIEENARLVREMQEQDAAGKLFSFVIATLCNTSKPFLQYRNNLFIH